MTPLHHPPLDLLIDHAAGTLDLATALFMDTHLALCPECRAEHAGLMAVGGSLVDMIEPVAMADDAFERLMQRIDADDATRQGEMADISADPVIEALPASLRPIGRRALKSRGWRTLVPGVRVLDLPVPVAAAGTVQLIKVGAGKGVPRHTHAGNEFTLVLSGAFNDETGHFGQGDVQITDAAIVHKPIAEAGDLCLVLAVTDAPLRLTGALGFLQRSLGY